MDEINNFEPTKVVKKVRKRKVDPFTETTDRIIETIGQKPKEFDKKAIYEARKKLYEDFVSKNIDLLIELKNQEQ